MHSKIILLAFVLFTSLMFNGTAPNYSVRNTSILPNEKVQDTASNSFMTENTWSRTFGKILWHDAGYSIRKLDDGFIIGGLTSNYKSSFGWLIKINEKGKMTWNRVYYDLYYIIDVEVAENGYLLVGITEDMNIGVIKTDGDGDIKWMKIFGGRENDGIANDHCVQKTDDGYIIAGYTHSFGAGNNDAWLIKIDENGNEVWNRTYGGKENDMFYSVATSTDGGYVAAGVSYSYGGNAWVVKVDKYGNIIWNRTYGKQFTDEIFCIKRCKEGYIMVGTRFIKEEKYYDLLVIKIDENGKEIWNRTYGENTLYEYGKCIDCIEDGYIICGLKEKDVQDFDLWLIKIDENGNEVWNRTYGRKGFDSGNSVLAIPSGYVVVGRLTEFPWKLFIRSDVWVIKTNSEGKIEGGRILRNI
ncbi:MAG: hypothetical protein J7L58_01480 [Thermoplasmata archaeon]|nr:hypothetical protein [Thermoplasmata archaeon]